jgi:hypothetical protein
MQLKNPKTNTQEILLTLIQKGKVSIMDFGYLCGFRTRISEIKNELNIGLETVHKSSKNRFGNNFTYSEHILPKSEIKNAIKLYNKL